MKLIYTEEFKGDLKKIRDKKIQIRIKKVVQKILDNPEIGKPLGYELFPLRTQVSHSKIESNSRHLCAFKILVVFWS